ncbi:hypothetical protein CsSME_00042712 [Camellia sinensis var. sinensis]
MEEGGGGGEGEGEVWGREGGVLKAGGLTSWSWVVEGDLVGERGFLGEGSARCGGCLQGVLVVCFCGSVFGRWDLLLG